MSEGLRRTQLALALGITGFSLSTYKVHNMMQLVLITPVLLDRAMNGVAAHVETVLDVVVPDDLITEDANNPESAPFIAPGLLPPLGRLDAD